MDKCPNYYNEAEEKAAAMLEEIRRGENDKLEAMLEDIKREDSKVDLLLNEIQEEDSKINALLTEIQEKETSDLPCGSCGHQRGGSCELEKCEEGKQ